MAVGLTDHVWSYREYIWWPVQKDAVCTWQMDKQIERLLIPALQGHLEGSPPANLPPTKVRRGQAKLRLKAA
jgi:hypothetical protein